MPPGRSYTSAKREAAAAETRRLVLETAIRLLDDGPGVVSMEAVAKAAGVTRLTVYKQFGSRRGLLEAVFDENGRRWGIARMAEAMQLPDPRAGIAQAIYLLCEFWGSHPSFARLHDAAAADPEFAEALATRNEKRRMVFRTLVERLDGNPAAQRDCADVVFGLTGMSMFRTLSEGRTWDQVAEAMKTSVFAVIEGYGLGAGNRHGSGACST
ncbi:TetR/AcrR family transcriptional regulator [Asticcacaulis solisilvae]|uniref:TetR/AcrR family transcriptional regulator n=1 Tax=Asticcacaulis solisilvae TaxID=1217274 RepID=UPI003FD6D73F